MRVFSGGDGGLLHVFTGTLSDWGLGLSGTGVGDVDGDGRDDIAATSIFSTTVYAGIDTPWTELGGSVAGSAGVPALVGAGSLAPDTTASVHVVGGLASGFGVLIVGASQAGVPFKGGILVPSIDFAFPFFLDAGGELLVSKDMPGTDPHAPPFYVQAWLLDAGAVQGASATNALMASPPL